MGASWSTVSINSDINDQFAAIGGKFHSGYKPELILGIATVIPLGKIFSFQPELLFHQKGYTSQYEDSEVSDAYTTTLNYLEVPVLVRLNFGKF